MGRLFRVLLLQSKGEKIKTSTKTVTVALEARKWVSGEFERQYLLIYLINLWKMRLKSNKTPRFLISATGQKAALFIETEMEVGAIYYWVGGAGCRETGRK